MSPPPLPPPECWTGSPLKGCRKVRLPTAPNTGPIKTANVNTDANNLALSMLMLTCKTEPCPECNTGRLLGQDMLIVFELASRRAIRLYQRPQPSLPALGSNPIGVVFREGPDFPEPCDGQPDDLDEPPALVTEQRPAATTVRPLCPSAARTSARAPPISLAIACTSPTLLRHPIKLPPQPSSPRPTDP